MKTAEVFLIEGGQAVKLPAEFRFDDPSVSIRREGSAVILEPIKATSWPDGFFADIRIDDPAFDRPPQGKVPAAPIGEFQRVQGLAVENWQSDSA